MSLEVNIPGRSVSTLSSGPPRGFSARGPSREFSHFSPKTPVRVTPSFRTSELRPTTFRNFNHQPISIKPTESSRGRNGLDLRSASHRPNIDRFAGLNTAIARNATRSTQFEPAIRPDFIPRQVGESVRPTRTEAQHPARVGEIRPARMAETIKAPKLEASRPNSEIIQVLKSAEQQAKKPAALDTNPIDSAVNKVERFMVFRLPSTESQTKPSTGETKTDQSDAKLDRPKTADNKRENTIIEYKKYSVYAQNLAEVSDKTQLIDLAPKPGVLARRTAENLSTAYRLLTAPHLVILGSDLSSAALAKEEATPESTLRLWRASQARSESADSGVLVSLVPRMTDLPKLAVETNQALQQAQETVQILAPEIAGLRIVTGVEARAALMIGETAQVQRVFEAMNPGKLDQLRVQETVRLLGSDPRSELQDKLNGVQLLEMQPALNLLEGTQLINTYKALIPIMEHKQALEVLGKSVEQRVQTLNQAQKMALSEKIIAETEPEELLENLSDDEKWRVEIFVKKIIHEKQIQQKVVVWEPGMRARRGKIRSALGHLEPGQVISGAELVSKIGPQTSDEIGPINPEGFTSGGGDQFRLALMEGEFSKGNEAQIIATSEANPTLEVVEEEVVGVREATAEEFHKEIRGRLPEIVAFAKQRAMVMLASM